MDNFKKYWNYIFKTSKKEKKEYYFSSFLVCTNCQRPIRGYVKKGLVVEKLTCPVCDCDTIKHQKETKIGA